jgi:hypothetical protein
MFGHFPNNLQLLRQELNMLDALRGRKTERTYREFGVMLAEELFRHALKAQFGDQIRIYALRTIKSPLRKMFGAKKPKLRPEIVTDMEWDIWWGAAQELVVRFTALVGPIDRGEHNRPGHLTVKAVVRLFSIESGVMYYWKPHFLWMTRPHKDQRYELDRTVVYCYEPGIIGDYARSPQIVLENPFPEMVDEQVPAIYVGGHHPEFYDEE